MYDAYMRQSIPKVLNKNSSAFQHKYFNNLVGILLLNMCVECPFIKCYTGAQLGC